MFVTRITNSPNNAIDKISGLIESIGDLVSFIIVIVYIACLNVYIGLIMLVVSICLGFFERMKVKIYAKNRKKQNKEFPRMKRNLIIGIRRTQQARASIAGAFCRHSRSKT